MNYNEKDFDNIPIGENIQQLQQILATIYYHANLDIILLVECIF